MSVDTLLHPCHFCARFCTQEESSVMRREGNKLTPVTVRNVKKPGLYGDGHGLALQVSESGSKAWVFRYMIDGRARKMGLGAIHTITLAEAREAALEARKKVRNGIDPIDEASAEKDAKRIEKAKLAAIPTFLECANKFIETKSSEWSNAKHAQMWARTFHPFKDKPAATERLNDLPVSEITTPLVLAALKPIWQSARVTATRVRQRIEAILDFARAHNWRSGDNPAARTLVEFAMPKAVAGKVHHAAMPYADVPGFMAELRAREGLAARLLECTVLTASRAGETRGARWEEVDLQARTWTVPGSRMKSRKPHTIPLSERCIQILESLPRVHGNEHLFPGRGSEPISEMPPRRLFEEMLPAYTLHGMRSSFRDWAGNETSAAREVAEGCLAHRLGDSVEQAYRRSDALQKRRELMAAWATFCEGGHRAADDRVQPD
jgi:integrase